MPIKGTGERMQASFQVIWPLKNLIPKHNTIAPFRKDNPKAIKKGASQKDLRRPKTGYDRHRPYRRRLHQAPGPEQQEKQLQPQKVRPASGPH